MQQHLKQQTDKLDVASLSSNMQRRYETLCLCIHSCTSVQQHPRQLHVPWRSIALGWSFSLYPQAIMPGY